MFTSCTLVLLREDCFYALHNHLQVSVMCSLRENLQSHLQLHTFDPSSPSRTIGSRWHRVVLSDSTR